MKNYQTLLFYLLIALVAYFLQDFKSCSGQDGQDGQTVYVERVDTITKWLPSQVITKKTVRYDTVHDRTVVTQFVQVDSGGVLILFEEREDTGEMKLYEGITKGEDGKCDYKYLVGIEHDSLKLLAIETDCRRKVTEIILENPLGYGDAGGAPSRLMIGAKVGMNLSKSHQTYGVQAAYKGLYAAANYAPGLKGPILEAGVMFPIGGKNKGLIAKSDTLTTYKQ